MQLDPLSPLLNLSLADYIRITCGDVKQIPDSWTSIPTGSELVFYRGAYNLHFKNALMFISAIDTLVQVSLVSFSPKPI